MPPVNPDYRPAPKAPSSCDPSCSVKIVLFMGKARQHAPPDVDRSYDRGAMQAKPVVKLEAAAAKPKNGQQTPAGNGAAGAAAMEQDEDDDEEDDEVRDAGTLSLLHLEHTSNIQIQSLC